jgi:hypothetical protein
LTGNARGYNVVIGSSLTARGQPAIEPIDVLEHASVTSTEAAYAPTSAVTLADAEREHILSALRDTDWVVGGPKGPPPTWG